MYCINCLGNWDLNDGTSVLLRYLFTLRVEGFQHFFLFSYKLFKLLAKYITKHYKL